MAMSCDLAKLMERHGKPADRRWPKTSFDDDPDAFLVAFRDGYSAKNKQFDRMTHGMGPLVVKAVINRYETETQSTSLFLKKLCYTSLMFNAG